MNYKKMWGVLKEIYGDKELKPLIICHEPNKEYPVTVNGLTIKGCMKYIENKFSINNKICKR